MCTTLDQLLLYLNIIKIIIYRYTLNLKNNNESFYSRKEEKSERLDSIHENYISIYFVKKVISIIINKLYNIYCFNYRILEILFDS